MKVIALKGLNQAERDRWLGLLAGGERLPAVGSFYHDTEHLMETSSGFTHVAIVKRLKKLIRYHVMRQLTSTAHSRSIPKFAPALLIAVRLPVPMLYPIRNMPGISDASRCRNLWPKVAVWFVLDFIETFSSCRDSESHLYSFYTGITFSFSCDNRLKCCATDNGFAFDRRERELDISGLV